MGLHLCGIQIAGSCFLFCFELFNSPLQSFNPGFHVLVDLGGISIIKFIRSVLPHGRLPMTTINRRRRAENGPIVLAPRSEAVENIGVRHTEESHLLRPLQRIAAPKSVQSWPLTRGRALRTPRRRRASRAPRQSAGSNGG
jgi:hypothetical protein